MRVRTDYMKVRTIREFVKGMEQARDTLRQEAEAGDLYSGLQADVLDPIIHNLNIILSGDMMIKEVKK